MTGALSGVSDEGSVWSSSSFAGGSIHASRLLFKGSLVRPLHHFSYRSYGFSVRCVQASAAKPLSDPLPYNRHCPGIKNLHIERPAPKKRGT